MISSAKACLISILLICVFVPVFAGLYTPQDFVSGTLVRVPDGASFYEIAGQLKKDNVIASIHTLRFFSFLFGGTHKIQAGTYMFTKPQGSVYIAQRLIKGRTDIPEVKVLIPEGKNAKEIAAILSFHIPALDPEEFIRESQSSEGYLFPDTYRFFITATTGEVITHLKETFVERTTLLETLRSDFDKPFPDVVIMASLLEE